MRLGKWQFTPGLWPTLGMIVLVALFARLALWQWHRAGEKRVMISAIQQAMAAPPVNLDALAAAHRTATLADYRHVRLQGHYDPRHQVLIQDMIHNSQNGYYVLTPFQLAGSGVWLLVNRGWIPDMRRSVPAEKLAVGSGRRSVSGLWAHLPRPGLRLGGGAPLPAGWPKVLLYPTRDQLVKALQRPLLTHSIWLDANAPAGFVRVWQPGPQFGPSRHIAYTLQWLGLAVTVFIVWIVVNMRRRAAGHHEIET